MSEYLGVRNDLVQEVRIDEDRLVNLIELLFVPERLYELLVGQGQRKNISPTPIICRELGPEVSDSVFSEKEEHGRTEY